jgi:hypothetical protein
MKRQVLVNVSPGDIWVSSGTVTSAIIRALSWQASPEDASAVVAVSVPPGVPGVVVVDVSGVDGEGVSVGRDKPGFVGGRVDVMKTDLVGAGVSSETLMHEASVKAISSITIQIFFMWGFYNAMITKCRIICLITDLNFHRSIHVKNFLPVRRAAKNPSRH